MTKVLRHRLPATAPKKTAKPVEKKSVKPVEKTPEPAAEDDDNF
jgi:hypothetical protein